MTDRVTVGERADESSRFAGMEALSCPLLIKFVLRGTPFSVTAGTLLVKLAPVTDSVVVPDPTGTPVGEMVEMTGAGTAKGNGAELARLGCWTKMPALDGADRRAAGTTAVNRVEPTKVVTSGVSTPWASHCTWLPGSVSTPNCTASTKFVPSTVIVRAPAPATELDGVTSVTVGTATISMAASAAAELPQKSVIVLSKSKTPVCVGVPAIVVRFGVIPGGSVPKAPASKGGVPPVK